MKRTTLLLVLLASVCLAAPPRSGHVSVTTGTAIVIGNSSQRYSLVVTNNDGTNSIFCSGDSAVTSSTGKTVVAGGSLNISSVWQGIPTASFPIYCIATGGTVDTDFFEAVK